MSLQQHCEFCDKSLYRYAADSMIEMRPASVVVLYTSERERMFAGPGDQSRVEFCNWDHAASWCIEQGRAAQ